MENTNKVSKEGLFHKKKLIRPAVFYWVWSPFLVGVYGGVHIGCHAVTGDGSQNFYGSGDGTGYLRLYTVCFLEPESDTAGRRDRCMGKAQDFCNGHSGRVDCNLVFVPGIADKICKRV